MADITLFLFQVTINFGCKFIVNPKKIKYNLNIYPVTYYLNI